MRVTNEEIAAALFKYGSNKAVASAVGLTEKALYERLKKSEMQALIAETRTRILETATDAARGQLDDAVRVLGEVMSDKSNAGSVRTQAAEGLIRQTIKLIEVYDIARRLEEVEAVIREENNEKH